MDQYLSTGSTLLNLAMTGNPHRGLLAGHYYFLVGDSNSGKTFLSMTCMAEATLAKGFADYRLIYDNVEDGMLVDLDRMFNEQVADRIEPPAVDKEGNPVFSGTVEEFYYHVDDAVKVGKPFIYVLDSMDALDAEADEAYFEKRKRAARKVRAEGDDEVKGTYGTAKAKLNSAGLRKVMRGLRKTGSILIIICQTRDSLASYGSGRTRAGGRALRFYATVEVWSSVVEQIKKTVNDRPRKVGVRCRLELHKNRLTGSTPSVDIDIYHSHGIDDLGTCVDYLVEERWWGTTGKNGGKIQATQFGIEATRERLIREIERKGLEHELRDLCGKCWAGVQDALALRRRNRYAPADAEGEPA